MNEEIKNAANQISRSANDKVHVLWRGKVVYTEAGKVKEFESNQEAGAFLGRCDAAGQLVE